MSKANDVIGDNIKDPLKSQIREILNKIGFGDGTSGKQAGNHSGVILNYTSNSVANIQDSIPHGLNGTPVHVFPTVPGNNAGASLQFHGADQNNITVSCNVPNTSFKLYVE